MDATDQKIELLAPGGDLDSIKAALAAGADAIYCGLKQFNARNRAANIELEDLRGVIRLAHRYDCQIFLTINIIIVESEFKALFSLLNRLVNTGLDGVIVQDLGLFYLLSKHFKSLKVHASTQVTTHNEGQVKFLSSLSVTRINLSRELNLNEIEALALVGHKNSIQSEVFVHGSNCISFSGLCYMSSVLDGKSGNRGRCSQPCREQYLSTPEGMNFPLNLKDNSAFGDLEALQAAGVDSVKIEGRVKKSHYVHTVVSAWRKRLDDFYHSSGRLDQAPDDSELYRVFNRGFSNAYLRGAINKDMFIDSPRDNSVRHYAKLAGDTTDEGQSRIKRKLHDSKTAIVTSVQDKIRELDTSKAPISICFSGDSGGCLRVSVAAADSSFELFSETQLVPAANGGPGSGGGDTSGGPLDPEALRQRFSALNETNFFVEAFNLDALQGGLFLPFKELSSIKKQIISLLNGSNEAIGPIAVPQLNKQAALKCKPSLSLLISSRQDLELASECNAELFFQLPNCFGDTYSNFVDLFLDNPKITPWFPPVLIGRNYRVAVDILRRVRPKRIVSNNTGITHEAWAQEIDSVAGPYLNTINSFSLLCLKERFNCSGAFISNELSQNQIKNIVAPEDFKLYYSIYHPIVLMTSRQCLVQQIEDCNKNNVDDACLLACNRSSSITNSKNETLHIDKTPGCYHQIYHSHDFLNTEIVSDLPGMFSSFLVDLRRVETATKIEEGRAQIIEHFERLLEGDPASKLELEKLIHPATHVQYRKGI